MNFQSRTFSPKNYPVGFSFNPIEPEVLFTVNIADPNTPTPQAADANPRPKPGLVKNAAFTWIKPEETPDYELLAVSPAAFDSIGLKRGEEKEEGFGRLVSGNRIFEEHYPWAQCYGGTFAFSTMLRGRLIANNFLSGYQL